MSAVSAYRRRYPSDVSRLGEVAFACCLALAGLGFGVRILLREIDAATTFPAAAR